MLVIDDMLTEGGSKVPLVPTPNMGGPIRPRFLIVHYTAGTSTAGALSWLANPAARASAHLVVGREGAVHQMVPFDRCAWHAGRSRWGEIVGLNRCSIGVELVNAGRLTRLGDGRWVSAFGQTIAEDDVLVATHRREAVPAGWQRFPPAQLEALAGVANAIRRAYAIEEMLGHDDIAPGRKVDPGPAFPMAELQREVMARAAA